MANQTPPTNNNGTKPKSGKKATLNLPKLNVKIDDNTSKEVQADQLKIMANLYLDKIQDSSVSVKRLAFEVSKVTQMLAINEAALDAFKKGNTKLWDDEKQAIESFADTLVKKMQIFNKTENLPRLGLRDWAEQNQLWKGLKAPIAEQSKKALAQVKQGEEVKNVKVEDYNVGKDGKKLLEEIKQNTDKDPKQESRWDALVKGISGLFNFAKDDQKDKKRRLSDPIKKFETVGHKAFDLLDDPGRLVNRIIFGVTGAAIKALTGFFSTVFGLVFSSPVLATTVASAIIGGMNFATTPKDWSLGDGLFTALKTGLAVIGGRRLVTKMLSSVGIAAGPPGLIASVLIGFAADYALDYVESWAGGVKSSDKIGNFIDQAIINPGASVLGLLGEVIGYPLIDRKKHLENQLLNVKEKQASADKEFKAAMEEISNLETQLETARKDGNHKLIKELSLKIEARKRDAADMKTWHDNLAKQIDDLSKKYNSDNNSYLGDFWESWKDSPLKLLFDNLYDAWTKLSGFFGEVNDWIDKKLNKLDLKVDDESIPSFDSMSSPIPEAPKPQSSIHRPPSTVKLMMKPTADKSDTIQKINDAKTKEAQNRIAGSGAAIVNANKGTVLNTHNTQISHGTTFVRNIPIDRRNLGYPGYR